MSAGFRMKKNLAMLLAALLIAVMLTGAAALVLRLTSIMGGDKMGKIDFEKEFTADEIQEIEHLSFQNQEGTMKVVVGDRFSVQGKDVPEGFVAEVKKGTLVVAYAEGSKWKSRIWTGNDFRDAEITITIPQDFVAGEIEFSNGSGKMEFSGLEAEEFVLDNGSGKMEFSSLEAEGFVLNNGSGTVEFSGMKAEDIEIENGSGRLDGTGLAGGVLKLTSGSGPTRLKQVTADMAEVDSGSGIVSMDETDIKGLELSSGSGAFELAGRVDGNLEIDSGSGNVSITLKNSRSEYSISADTGSGALWLDGERLKDFQEKNPDAAYAIEVDSGSGRVAIGFSEEDERTENKK